MFAGHGEGSLIEAALISGEKGDWASSAIEVLAKKDSTMPETINGGLNCKTNQKARYCDGAACFVGEGEKKIF